MNTQCVIREVRGTNEFVLVSDVLRRMGSLQPKERVYIGRFAGYAQKCGPYGSDQRTVCMPLDRANFEFGEVSDDGKQVILLPVDGVEFIDACETRGPALLH